MTIRQDLDALVDSMEGEYAGATSPLEQTRAVAAAALSSAYLIADALDELIDRVDLMDRLELVDRVAAVDPVEVSRQLVALKEDVGDLQRKLEHLRNTTKRSRR
jgi:hypothetical protein